MGLDFSLIEWDSVEWNVCGCNGVMTTYNDHDIRIIRRMVANNLWRFVSMRRHNVYGTKETIGTIACQARIDGMKIANLAYYFGNAGVLDQATIAGVIKVCVETVHKNLLQQGQLDCFTTCTEALEWLDANGFAIGQAAQRGRSMTKAVMLENGGGQFRVQQQEPERRIDHGIPLVDDDFMAEFQRTHERLQKEQEEQKKAQSWESIEQALSKPVEVVEVKKDLGQDYTDDMVKTIAVEMYNSYLLKKLDIPDLIQQKTILMEKMAPYFKILRSGGTL